MPLCTDIQDAVVRRLAMLAAEDVPVHGLLRGDTVSLVNSVLEQLGLIVVVLPALPTRINGNISGPWVEAMEFVVRVIEHPLLNQLPLTRWHVMERIITTLDGWQCGIPETQRCTLSPTVTEALSGEVIELELTASIGGPMTAAIVPDSLADVTLTPADTGVLKRGMLEVPNNTASGSDLALVFATPFVAPPRVLLLRCIDPADSPKYNAAVVAGSLTAAGCLVRITAALGSAPVPKGGYAVAFLALL